MVSVIVHFASTGLVSDSFSIHVRLQLDMSLGIQPLDRAAQWVLVYVLPQCLWFWNRAVLGFHYSLVDLLLHCLQQFQVLP